MPALRRRQRHVIGHLLATITLAGLVACGTPAGAPGSSVNDVESGVLLVIGIDGTELAGTT